MLVACIDARLFYSTPGATHYVCYPPSQGSPRRAGNEERNRSSFTDCHLSWCRCVRSWAKAAWISGRRLQRARCGAYGSNAGVQTGSGRSLTGSRRIPYTPTRVWC
ncbi:unnamed protein product [Natator depressus]